MQNITPPQHFKDDTLTGADTSHLTNVMFIQPSNIHTSKVAQKGLLFSKTQRHKALSTKWGSSNAGKKQHEGSEYRCNSN